MSGSAKLCREMGWDKGTLLIGRESGDGWWNEDVIGITAVGMDGVLAISIGHRNSKNPEWDAKASYESAWTLMCRDWKKIDRLPWEPTT